MHRGPPVSRITLLAWNIQGKAPAKVGLPEVLHLIDPDLVMLMEADPDELLAAPDLEPWAAQGYMDASAGGPPGMAILGQSVMREPTTLTAERLADSAGVWDRSRAMSVGVELPQGDIVQAIAVHAKAPLPFPPINARPRNRQFDSLAAWITVKLATGQRMIVAGDFNAVSCHFPRLTDVGLALGQEAPTWRPFLRFLPAVLRLDRVFVSAGITPVSFAVPCRPSRSDHCPVVAVLDV
jgi:endonuclease/exonuclease/phosphatase family metal-dependent hydrolase